MTVTQKANIVSVDPDPYRHMASLRHNELRYITESF